VGGGWGGEFLPHALAGLINPLNVDLRDHLKHLTDQREWPHARGILSFK